MEKSKIKRMKELEKGMQDFERNMYREESYWEDFINMAIEYGILKNG